MIAPYDLSLQTSNQQKNQENQYLQTCKIQRNKQANTLYTKSAIQSIGEIGRKTWRRFNYQMG